MTNEDKTFAVDLAKAMHDGLLAGEIGQPSSDNPYESYMQEAWRIGWEEGVASRYDAQKQKPIL